MISQGWPCAFLSAIIRRAHHTGDNVDLYIPRKCSWTNRLIGAKDHASVQLNIGHLDEQGIYNGQFTTFAISGFVRSMASTTGLGRRPSTDSGRGACPSDRAPMHSYAYPRSEALSRMDCDGGGSRR